MKCRIILELLAILFFTGCYNREQISRLDEAEALIQNKPDSALTILQQLKSEGGQAEQARYALLYSEALDKNHIKVTNDSLIREPLPYQHYLFQHQRTSHEYLQLKSHLLYRRYYAKILLYQSLFLCKTFPFL